MSLGEFKASSGSGSTSYRPLSTVDPTATSIQKVNLQMEGFGATAALKIYSVAVVSGSVTSTQVFSLAVTGPVLNVSAAGAANTGAITTGNITSVGILHSVNTQRLFTVGGYLAAEDTGTLDTSCNILEGASVNPAVWGLLRYTQSSGWQQSTSTDSSSHRIWTAIGSGTSSGAANLIQLSNGSGAFSSATNYSFTASSGLMSFPGASSAPSAPASGVGGIYADGTGQMHWYDHSGSTWTLFGTGGGGSVTSIMGTAYQIVASSTTGAITLSLPATVNTNIFQSVATSGVAFQANGGVWSVDASGNQSGNGTCTFGVGFISTNGSSTTVNIPNGGVTALSLISIRNDGASSVTIARTTSTARTYGFGVTSGGSLILNDDTAGTYRMSVTTTGVFIFGASVSIDTVGNISGTGVAAFSGGFNTSNSASTAIQAPNGGVTALSLISIRNDGNSSVTIARTSSTARTYGFGVTTGGSLILNDDTAGTYRMAVTTTGTFSFGTGSTSTVAIDQSGNISFTGSINGTLTTSAITVAGTATNTISAPSGGVTGKYLVATQELFLIATSAPASPGTGQYVIYADNSTGLNYWNGTSYTPFPSGGGVTSLIGTANQVSVSSSTGSVTVSLPNTVTIQTFNSSATGTNLAFQGGSGTFSVNGNGAVSCAQSVTSAVGFNSTGTAYNSFQTAGGMSFGTALGDKIVLYDGGTGYRYGLGVQSNVLQLYSGPGGNVAIGTGGGSSSFTTNVLFAANGYVGFNTGSPNSQLHVLGSAGAGLPTIGAGVIYLQDSGNGVGNGGGVLFGAQQGVFAAIKGYLANGTPAGYLSFFTQNVSGVMGRGMTIFQNGAVTIGNQLISESLFSILPPSNVTTASTGCLLTVGEASGNASYNMGLGYYLRAGTTWTGVIQAQAGGGATNLTINPNGGYVGVGIENPGVALDVSGYIRGTGYYTNAGLVIDSGGNYKGNVSTTGYVSCGPLYSIANTSTPGSPASGSGGMQYYSGSTWWVWNGSSYVTHDFLASTGVSSLGAATGVITLSSGLTMVANVLTIGQPVDTTASVSFVSVSVSGTAYNAINSTGGVSAATFYVGATNVIDSSGNYKGNVNTTGYVSCGPVYANTSVAINGPLYSAAVSSAPTNPASSYGGMQYSTGSSWYVWNGSSYVLHDLLSGMTYTGGTGVSISGSTIAIGQPVDTTNSVTFATIQLNGSSGVGYPIKYSDTSGHYFQVDTNGTIGMSGGCGALGFYLTGGGTVIDTSGNFVSNVNTAGYITTTQAVSGNSFKIGTTTIINSSTQFIGSGGVSTSGQIATSSTVNSTGYQVSSNTMINSSGQWIGFGINQPSYGATVGSVTIGGTNAIDGSNNHHAATYVIGTSSTVINSSGQFVGSSISTGGITCQGVSAPGYSIGCSEFAWWTGSAYSYAPNTTASGTPSSMTVSGGIVTSFTTVSDARMKTILSRPSYGLYQLRGLQVAKYTWNDESRKLYGNLTTHSVIGFISQEIQERMPEACYEDQYGNIGFHKDALLGAIVSALQQIDSRLSKFESIG